MEGASAAGDAPGSSPSTNEDNAQIGTSETRKLPLISLAILRRAIGNIDSLRRDGNLSRAACEGVLLKDDDKKQGQAYTSKYWVDKDLYKSCWMFLAMGLSIIGDRPQCWTWIEEEEECYKEKKKVEIAELKEKTLGLAISGKCKTIMLSPKTAYEVDILVKMRPASYGWEVPVNVSLTLPDSSKQGGLEFLDRLEKDKWSWISIGKFETTPKTVGEINFSLTQTNGHGKAGLLVKGVVFKPLV